MEKREKERTSGKHEGKLRKRKRKGIKEEERGK